MLTCPDCRSINPPHHNFCQGCGRSLNHHTCHNCSGDVGFDLENCPQCNGIVGTYWRAIIELAADNQSQSVDMKVTQLEPASNLPSKQPQSESEPSQIPSLMVTYNIEPNPWESPLPEETTESPASPPIPTASQTDIDPNLEPNFWDSQPLGSAEFDRILPIVKADSEPILATVTAESSPTDEIKIPVDPSLDPPLVATIYLDKQSRYRQIDPVAIQLLVPGDSCQTIVIDRQPFCNSPLETLMKQDPIVLDKNTTVSATVESQPRSPEDYRQWQTWDANDVPKVARAYIALRASLSCTIPTIKDGWNDEGKTISLVEDRSHWTLLLDRWNDPQISSTQIVYWLDRTLKLWVDLEPWKMRQSLLELNNLLLDEDSTICFQRLCPEQIDSKLQLADLAKLWRKLFDRSGSIPSAPLAESIAAMETGELARIEEVRSRLQQIAYELEPKSLTSPLLTGGTQELPTNSQDAPTIVFAKKLIDLEDAAATHTGKKRDHNEDCFGIVSRVNRSDSPKGRNVSGRGLYILCDGMGGHAGGEIASAMTVDSLRDYFAVHWGDTLPDEETIRDGIIATNEAVFDLNQKNASSGNGRMGTTLVLVLVQDRDIVVAHVGDSRCYAITPSQGSIQLTIDHEVGQQQILRGVDPEIAYGRPDSYQLTQAIGPRDRNYIAPDIRFFELQEDTLILLASDGLTDNQLVETYWLTNIAPLLLPHNNLQDGVDRLIDFANDYNGHDNITALAIRARLG
jgi:protein phosphatase